MIRLDQFPAPATERPAEVAVLFFSGVFATPGLIVYEQARDFLSAPRQFVILDIGPDAWLMTDADGGEAYDTGIFLLPDSVHCGKGEQHLQICLAGRTLEIICQRCQLAGFQMHVCSAEEALRNWWLSQAGAEK